jgi:hypothetical protein
MSFAAGLVSLLLWRLGGVVVVVAAGWCRLPLGWWDMQKKCDKNLASVTELQ